MIRITTISKIHLLLLGVVMIIGPGCNKNGVFKKSGPVRSEIRVLPAISEVILYDRVNLILTEDSSQELRVETGENLIPDIETSMVSNILTIRDNSKYKWMHDLDTKVNVYMSVDGLKKITFYGAGEVTSTNELTPETFEIDSWNGTGNFRLKLRTEYTSLIIRTGNADIMLEGSSPECYIYCADQGGIDLRNYPVKNILLNHRSVRDAFIYVTNRLDATLLYTGNVYYKGSPQDIILKTNSTGRLSKIP